MRRDCVLAATFLTTLFLGMCPGHSLSTSPAVQRADPNQRRDTVLGTVFCVDCPILRQNINHIYAFAIEEHNHHSSLGDTEGCRNLVNSVRTECPDGSDIMNR
jgi:hypothetical protein